MFEQIHPIEGKSSECFVGHRVFETVQKEKSDTEFCQGQVFRYELANRKGDDECEKHVASS